MTQNLRVPGVSLAIFIPLIGLASPGCADPRLTREARGPGTVFTSLDAAAIDALAYAFLQALAAHDTKRMRGGTIHRMEKGFSYGEIVVAGPLAPFRVRIPLTKRDVAWFLIYYRSGRYDVDRANEQPSPAHRRIVRFVDPLHRPLYILHPSLVIRVYRGEDATGVEVADLRYPAEELRGVEE